MTPASSHCFFERNENGIHEAERKYKRYLYGIAQNMLSSSEDAEECANNTYLAARQSDVPITPITSLWRLSESKTIALSHLPSMHFAAARSSVALTMTIKIIRISGKDGKQTFAINLQFNGEKIRES